MRDTFLSIMAGPVYFFFVSFKTICSLV
jgi:hypothetical protein